jgi:dextranase
MFIEIYPHKAQYLKGETVCLNINVTEKLDASVVVSLYHHGALTETMTAPANELTTVTYQPETLKEIEGFWVEATLWESGKILGVAYTAYDVVREWQLAPRYGFLSDFSTEQADDEKIQIMNKYHLNIVQFYDWMYRHHQFVTDLAEYEDPLGKQIKQSVIKKHISRLHKHGMKALAYGAIYGAQQEYVDKHPDQAIRGADYHPLKFLPQIYFMDIHPDSAWHEHILKQFRAAIAYGFDGIHLDQ